MPAPTKLTNPYSGVRDHKLTVEIPLPVFTYIFRQVLPGMGPKQAILATMLDKLHKEMLDRGIAPEWDIENESKIVAILNDLNFKP